MKILFLVKFLNNSGVTTHMLELSKNLIREGHEVHLLSGGLIKKETVDDFIKKFNKIGVKTHNTFFPNFVSGEKSRLFELFRYLISLPHSLNKIKKINPDIIHVHWPVTSFIPKIYKLFISTPFIITFHISGISNTILHKKADSAIAISSNLKKEIIEEFNYIEENVYLVYNGVNKNKFEKENQKIISIKNKLNIDHNKLILTFVGSFNKRKGLDILIEACSKIINQVPDFEINLVGEGNEEWLNKVINKSKLKEKINIFPFQDPYDFYNISDIFVLPSRKEGFPLVVVEAMLMEIAVIRSNTSGAADQIIDGKDGFVFESEDVEELSVKLKRLMNDKQLRKTFAERGHQKALKNFTAQKMSNKTLAVYKETIDKNKLD